MIKVLFVISDRTGRSTGQQVAALAAGLSARGCKVMTVAVGENHRAATKTGSEDATLVFRRNWSGDLRPFYHLGKVVRGFRPDVVHFWHCGHSALSPYTLTCRSVAKRFVTPDRACLMANRSFWPQRARWLVPSRAESASWSRTGIASNQLIVIPPAPVNRSDGPSEPMGLTASARCTLDLPPGARVVFGAGRLAPAYGWREAIWSFNILHFIHPELHLLIAGDGPDQLSLERFTCAIRMQDNVRLLGWRNDIADLTRLADVVWCPSLVDGIPIVMMEALTAGKPVVAADHPSIREIVTHGQTALLCPPKDRPALAKQTRRLLEDRNLATALGAAGQRLAHNQFGSEQWVERHLQAYRQAA